MVPHLDGIHEGCAKLAERLIRCSAQVAGKKYDVKVLEGRRENHLKVFYLDHPSLKSPLALTSDSGITACALFAHAVCDWLKQVPVAYDIVQCDGLCTALIPALLKTLHKDDVRLASLKAVVALPGIEDKACIDMAWIRKIGLPNAVGTSEKMEFYGKLSILKGVYLYADAIVVPHAHIKENIEKNRGKDIGMEGVLFQKMNALHEVAIGSDLKKCDPNTDPVLEANYDADKINGKNKCKAALTQKLHIKKDRPLVAFIGKLNRDSGIDLVNDILDDLMDRQVSFIIAGEGSDAYQNAVDGWQDEFKGCVAWMKGKPSFDNVRKILSAADVLLIPSKSENFGRLHQIAMKYGCVVVARNQGCAAHDIQPVVDLEKINPSDNGFLFDRYDSDQFFDATMDALDVYATPAWNDIRANAMKLDASIVNTADACAKLYRELKL